MLFGVMIKRDSVINEIKQWFSHSQLHFNSNGYELLSFDVLSHHKIVKSFLIRLGSCVCLSWLNFLMQLTISHFPVISLGISIFLLRIFPHDNTRHLTTRVLLKRCVCAMREIIFTLSCWNVIKWFLHFPVHPASKSMSCYSCMHFVCSCFFDISQNICWAKWFVESPLFLFIILCAMR